jgi:type IX secretion system PorP/SprF family membrane protein
MVKKSIILTIFSFLMAFASMGQDIHFTQYMHSPLNLNPGYTGRFDGDFRVVGNFRSQWGSLMVKSFQTSGISYDQIFKVSGHEISAGIVYANDFNSIGNLQQNKLQLSGAYNTHWKGNYLSGGIQMGILHKSIDFENYSYPDQYDHSIGDFNTEWDNGEDTPKSNMMLFDFNAGIVWSRQLTDKIYPEIGLSMFHINRPTETFLGIVNKLPTRKVADFKINYKFNEKIIIVPSALFMYDNKAQELVWGVIGKYKMEENKVKLTQVFAGLQARSGFNRNFDSGEIMIGGIMKEYQLAFSYDFTSSGINTAPSLQGAFEISLIYIAQSTEPKIFNVPCDRY